MALDLAPDRGLPAYFRFRWRLLKLYLALIDKPRWRDLLKASINGVLQLASTSPERTVLLAEIWQLGSRNEDFLRKLFELYEPMREELRKRGLAVHAVRELGGGGDAIPAGVWSIATSTRLTDVTTSSADTLSTSASETAAREGDLFAYAAAPMAHSRTRFLAQWQQLRKPTANGPLNLPLTESDLDKRIQMTEAGLNYVVRRLTFDSTGRATVEVERAGYGQIMRSCDYLIEEAFIAAGLCALGTPLRLDGSWLLKAMPARRTVMHEGVAELLTEPRRRAVGIGVAAIVTTRELDMEPRLRYARRSFQVGTYPGLYHALPTGMFNADSADGQPHDQRQHPGRVMLSEFLEEYKGVDGLGEMGSDPAWLDRLRSHLRALGCDAAATDSQLALPTPASCDVSPIRVWVSGLAFDLLSLRPEICCVVGLPSDSLAEVILNEEVDEWFSFPGPNAKTLEDLPRSSEWVRSGYAAFALAHAIAWRGLDPRSACTPTDFGL